jgi:hypothetical protein
MIEVYKSKLYIVLKCCLLLYSAVVGTRGEGSGL